MVEEIGNNISFEELVGAESKLRWYKDPGINDNSPNVIKALNNEKKHLLFEFTQNWTHDENIAYED